MKSGVFLLLGSNIGDRKNNLDEALLALQRSGIEILTKSSIYETAPWGNPDQPPFYNLAIEIKTRLSPNDLLHELLAIERAMGRERKEKWGERSIDLDILLYGNEIVAAESLTIPHPRMVDRRFVLTPLDEIAPMFLHPTLHETIHSLLLSCPDLLSVKKVSDLPR